MGTLELVHAAHRNYEYSLTRAPWGLVVMLPQIACTEGVQIVGHSRPEPKKPKLSTEPLLEFWFGNCALGASPLQQFR